jgi:hypothetical protein
MLQVARDARDSTVARWIPLAGCDEMQLDLRHGGDGSPT